VLHPRLSRLRSAIDLDKDIRRLAVDGDEAQLVRKPASVQNTVKYHEVCRSVQNPPSNPARRVDGEREPALVMASARDSHLGFSRIYNYFSKA
jgi:hypothetical protein